MLLKIKNDLFAFRHGPDHFIKQPSGNYYGRVTASGSYDTDEHSSPSSSILDITQYDNYSYHRALRDAVTIFSDDYISSRGNSGLFYINDEDVFNIGLIHPIKEYDYIIIDDSFNVSEIVVGMSNISGSRSIQDHKEEVGELLVKVKDRNDHDMVDAYDQYTSAFHSNCTFFDDKKEPNVSKYLMCFPNSINNSLAEELLKYTKNSQIDSFYKLNNEFFYKFDNYRFGQIMNYSEEKLLTYKFKDLIYEINGSDRISVHECTDIIEEAINAYFKYSDELKSSSTGCSNLLKLILKWNSLHGIRSERKMKFY